MEPDRRELVRVVGAQVGATAAVAALAAFWGLEAAKAALVGGAVAFLPNAYFAWAGARRGGERPDPSGLEDAAEAAVAQAGRLFRRWGGKLALTVALMVIAIVGLGVGSGAFFAGLGLALAAQHLMPLAAVRRRDGHGEGHI